MSEQQHHVASSQNYRLPWWIRLCRWLWKLSAFLGTSVFLALGVNLASTWLTTPKGALPADTPLRVLTTYWPISLLVGCCFLLLTALFWAISRWSIPSTTLSIAITMQDRERMLRRLHFRYEQMLAQSLQGAVQIELGLASRPAAIYNAASLLLRLPEQPEQVLPPHTSIVDAYEQAQQELLILGEPGSGKSTLLLELAHHLVEQAEQNVEQPLPVLLPLSSWAVKRPALQDWIIEQFVLLYDVPRQFIYDWMRANLVLPLLDGLDEMDEAARPSCIAAINTYHREHLQPLVVCSRIKEYDTATFHERIALHTAVVVQPLSQVQIDAYLVILGNSLDALRTTLKKNLTLAMLATTPLMVQILMLTYHGTTVWQLSHKEAVLRQQIWTDYVQHMVERKGDAEYYPLDCTVTWLGWLARQLRDRNQTIFSLEYLQPDFLPKKYIILYRWSAGLTIGPIVGLVAGLFFGLLGGLGFGLIGGLFVALHIGLQSKIVLAEMITVSWKRLKLSLVAGLVAGLFSGLVAGLFFSLVNGWVFGLFDKFLAMLVAGLFFGLLAMLFFGLEGKQLAERQVLFPNEGIHRSLKNGSLFLVVFGLIAGLFVGLLGGLVAGLPVGLVAGLFFGLFVGLVVGLGFGLHAVVQHYILRFWLWRSHLFPLKAIPFLEDATARILLRRVGGGYSFTHRLLLDYFADLDTAPPSPSPGTHPMQQSPPP